MKFGPYSLRHELKFYIRYPEYVGLRERLKRVLAPDKHTVDEDGYHIRSLYFDNMYETALIDKVNGIFKRKKYRVRIYNIEDKIIRLERKSRYGEYVNKIGATLSKEQYAMLCEGEVDFMRGSDVQLFRDFYLDNASAKLSPTVIVDYVREAYVFPISDVRITFDKRLCSSVNSLDIFDKQLVTASVVKEPMLIMEVKYNQFLPQHINDLLNIESHNRSAISKYVLCRQVRKSFAD